MYGSTMEMPPIRKQKILCLGGVAASEPMLGALARWVAPAAASLDVATLDSLRQGNWDAVLVDADAPGWRDALVALGEVAPEVPVVVIQCGPDDAGEEEYRRAATWVTRIPDETDHDFTTRVAIQLEQGILEGALGRGDSALVQLIDTNPYGIAVYSMAGYFVRGNRAFERVFGMAPPPDLCNWEVPFHCTKEIWEVRARVMQGETVSVPPLWLNPRDECAQGMDHPACISTVSFALRHACGEPQYMVTMFEDITARATAERDLQQAHADLKNAYDALDLRVRERTADLLVANESLRAEAQQRERLQQQLIRKNRELEDFSFRVGHDIKNHLLVIRVLLQGARDPEAVEQNAQAVLESSEHLIGFVERLLQMARAGRVIGERVPTDLAAVVQSVFERASQILNSNGNGARHCAEVCFPEPLPLVWVDPAAMEQVFANLVGNAVRHRHAELPLRIEVTAVPVGDRIEIHHRDNGQGLDDHTLEHVFDMGFTTDECGTHTGFGLPIVKKIVEAHGGTVRAESPGRGQGACFILDLPATCLVTSVASSPPVAQRPERGER